MSVKGTLSSCSYLISNLFLSTTSLSQPPESNIHQALAEPRLTMSKCGPNNTSQEECMAEPSGRVYQFVDLSNDDPEVRKQNLTNARSYITKNNRRRRLLKDAKKVRFVIWTPTTVKHKQSQNLLTSMNLSLLDSASSPWPYTDTMPTMETQRKWSPFARQLMHRRMLLTIRQ